jgi:hypothetical protein
MPLARGQHEKPVGQSTHISPPVPHWKSYMSPSLHAPVDNVQPPQHSPRSVQPIPLAQDTQLSPLSPHARAVVPGSQVPVVTLPEMHPVQHVVTVVPKHVPPVHAVPAAATPAQTPELHSMQSGQRMQASPPAPQLTRPVLATHSPAVFTHVEQQTPPPHRALAPQLCPSQSASAQSIIPSQSSSSPSVQRVSALGHPASRGPASRGPASSAPASSALTHTPAMHTAGAAHPAIVGSSASRTSATSDVEGTTTSSHARATTWHPRSIASAPKPHVPSSRCGGCAIIGPDGVTKTE